MEVLAFLTGNFWAIAAAVSAACLAAYLAGRNGRSARQADACSTFRSKVLAELGAIYPTPGNWPTDIDTYLRAVFPSLQVAISEFRPFVPWWRRRAFDRAWNIYRRGKDGRLIDVQYYWQYIPHSGAGVESGKPFTHDNRLTYKKYFKENVDGLLRFASET